jgi:uncharacterized NAD(P)/FAD-binding protein YdhS
VVERIVIVGAGFCGSLLATLLLRSARQRPLDVVLIGRDAAVGRGVAYAQREVDYLLNVPAGRLSADPADPLQFLRFAQDRAPATDAEDFLPRSWYGDYIEAGLRTALRGAPSAARLSIRQASATALRRLPADAGGRRAFEVTLAGGGETVGADAVVLALGNPPPASLPAAQALAGSGLYCADPWQLPARFTASRSLLIVGNGLTMADVALRLSADPRRTPVLHTLSRRGLLPQLQTEFRAGKIPEGAAVLEEAVSIRRLFAASRGLARRVELEGGDWREVVTFVRHAAPTLWPRLSDAEKRRFLRHVQCHWDTHRHRMPPSLSARLTELRRAGTLEINAGRLLSLTPEHGRVRVCWRPRGGDAARDWLVDGVINATGSDYALEHSTDPLVEGLLAAGMISADALKLGVRTDPEHALIGADGRSQPDLYYVGPQLRASFWEATAVTELRDHVRALARHLLGTSSAAGGA